MSNGWQDDLLGGTVATELVCKDHAGLASGGSQELRERKLPGQAGMVPSFTTSTDAKSGLLHQSACPGNLRSLWSPSAFLSFRARKSSRSPLYVQERTFAEPFLLLSTA